MNGTGFAAETQPTRQASSGTATAAVLTPRQRATYALMVAFWGVLTVYFWSWWLQPAHVGNWLFFSLVSVSIFYGLTLLPSFYVFYLGFMRRPINIGIDELPPGRLGKVALVTLTVPGSESLSIVRRQMLAMKSVAYPHDNWILVDKEHSPAIEKMAGEMGILYFCRHDESRWGRDRVATWNQEGPPFQMKTKAGNVNAWLDEHGDNYTHFTQLDIDHNPVPGYLDRVLGFFKNRNVAWVQAPSVYGNHEHWTARGASEQELVLQGPLQMGFFGFSRTPFIIGSHCTYAMAAIRSIGGFQPTRAEDHLDTVILASRGYEGVFLPEAIAVGDGPETFGTYCAQQFAWAYSMIQVLFAFTPRLIRHYTPRQAIQFVFVQTWYPLSSLTTLFLFFAPLISLTTDTPISRVGFVDFFLHSWPAAITGTIIWMWSRRWQQPRNLRLSWRGVALQVARWVTVFSAFMQVLLRVRKPYMITVKGLGGDNIPRFRMAEIGPYAVLIASSFALCWVYMLGVGRSANQGMLFFALEGALLFWLLIVVVLGQDLRALRNAGVSRRGVFRHRAIPLAASAALLLAFIVTAAAAAESIWEAVIS